MKFNRLSKMSRVVLLTLLGAGGCAGRGWAPLWSQASPETMVTVDPLRKTITLYNSKDVSVDLGTFSGKHKDTEWRIEGLKFLDTASTVREANVQQMAASIELTRVLAQTVEKLAMQLAPLALGTAPDGLPTEAANASIR